MAAALNAQPDAAKHRETYVPWGDATDGEGRPVVGHALLRGGPRWAMAPLQVALWVLDTWSSAHNGSSPLHCMSATHRTNPLALLSTVGCKRGCFNPMRTRLQSSMQTVCVPAILDHRLITLH